MDEVTRLCQTAAGYPKNLTRGDISPFILESFFDRLTRRQDQLFQKEDELAALDFLDLHEGAKGKEDTASGFREKARALKHNW